MRGAKAWRPTERSRPLLPGETALTEADGERARVVALEVASPDRAAPICAISAAAAAARRST